MNELKRFWNEEEGLATLEIVLIIVVLVGLAIIFKDKIVGFVNALFGKLSPEVDKFDVPKSK